MNTIPDLSCVEWVKSSYSNGGGGDCLEWAPATTPISGTVPVRDSKTPDGPTLALAPSSWTAFVSAVTRGTL